MANIEAVQATDTPNEGRLKWNAADEAMNNEIGALDGQLDTHKTSGDHDSRYYTETEIDASLALRDSDINGCVKKTGDESITGKKSFEELEVKSDSPALSMSDSQSVVLGGLYGVNDDGVIKVGMRINKNPITPTYDVLFESNIVSEYVNFPIKKITMDGDPVATEKYVQDRVKTGNIMLSESVQASLNSSGEVLFGNNGERLFTISRNCTLRQIFFMRCQDDFTEGKAYNWLTTYAFNNIESDPYSYKWLRAKISAVLSAGELFFEVQLSAIKMQADGSIVETVIYQSQIGQVDGIASPAVINFYVGILLIV